MGLEDKLPSGVLLSTVEGLAGYMRKSSLWPATFGLACCAIEMMALGSAPKHDISRFGMERFSASPRQADLMIVAGRVSQKMAPVLRQIVDQLTPRPEQLMDAIIKLHTLIGDTKLGPNREAVIKEVELAAMNAKPTIQMKGLLA